MKKIRDVRGETLVETLAALLIIMFAVLFLTGSVVTAARSNAKMRNIDNSVHFNGDPESGTVVISGDTGTDDVEIAVNVYTDNGYRYYSEMDISD